MTGPQDFPRRRSGTPLGHDDHRHPDGWFDTDNAPVYDNYPDDVVGEMSADGSTGSRARKGSWSSAVGDPRYLSPHALNKRTGLLLAATLLVPGSAQIVAGNRRIGRMGLMVTVVCWGLALLAVLSIVFWRTPLIFVLTNGLTAPAISLVLAGLAVGWGLLFIDALRLAKPGLLSAKARVIAIIATVVAIVVTSGGLGYTAHLVNVTRSAVGDIFGGGLPFRPVDGRYNLLLMGADAGEDRVGLRPDSMTVISIDAKSGQTVTISLPRNLQNAPFPEDSPMHDVYPEGYNCGDECLLNAIYTDVTENHSEVYGDAADPGAEAMMDAASGVLDIEVQGYAMIDMAGFEQLVDALGGITIDVGGEVPIGGGTNESTGEPNPIDGYIEPGVQHLDGFHALWYARSREGASDYDRQARQRCVQTAMLKQMNPVNVVAKFEDLAAAGTQVVVTDIPQSSIGSFMDLALEAKNHELVGYAAGPPYYDASFPTYPDYNQLHADVRDLLADADGSSAQGSTQHAPAAVMGARLSAHAPLLPTEESGELGSLTAQDAEDPSTQLSPNGTCSVP